MVVFRSEIGEFELDERCPVCGSKLILEIGVVCRVFCPKCSNSGWIWKK